MRNPKILHLGRIQEGRGHRYLFLREVGEEHYSWFVDDEATAVRGETIADALTAARRFWKEKGFRTVHCGFRYTLPERDEHGQNALFHQMAASYSSFNGVYFDNDLGHNCTVAFASEEALKVWREHCR